MVTGPAALAVIVAKPAATPIPTVVALWGTGGGCAWSASAGRGRARRCQICTADIVSRIAPMLRRITVSSATPRNHAPSTSPGSTPGSIRRSTAQSACRW